MAQKVPFQEGCVPFYWTFNKISGINCFEITILTVIIAKAAPKFFFTTVNSFLCFIFSVAGRHGHRNNLHKAWKFVSTELGCALEKQNLWRVCTDPRRYLEIQNTKKLGDLQASPLGVEFDSNILSRVCTECKMACVSETFTYGCILYNGYHALNQGQMCMWNLFELAMHLLSGLKGKGPVKCVSLVVDGTLYTTDS